MTEHKPAISKGRSFSAIWVIPIIAIIIGALLVIQAQLAQGPTITISFDTAEGLEAGKTKVKILDVEIGLVEDIALINDVKGVEVTVKLDKRAEALLREDTQFWVVRARIGAGGVSGLGTLLSGAYIQIAPGTGTPGRTDFDGLETPPLTPVGAPGLKLSLYSSRAGSVSAGDAILYKGYKVGRVENYQFDKANDRIQYDVFIDAPFHELVGGNTRFWNISGISLKASASGLEVNTGSLETLIAGGVAFGTPEGLERGASANNGDTYRLYSNYDEMINRPFKNKLYFVVSFTQSLRGLVPGAPVDYRGITVGQVERVLLKEFIATNPRQGSPIPVLISIEPGQLYLPDTEEATSLFAKKLDSGIELGLKASLQTGNLLTGSLFISLDFFPDEKPGKAGELLGYRTIPTMSGGLARIEYQINELLTKLNKLNVEGSIAELNKILASLEQLVSNPETQGISAEVNATLAELRATMQGLSPQLNSSVTELNETLSNLEKLTRTLADKPNALVMPTDFPADPEPEAKPQ